MSKNNYLKKTRDMYASQISTSAQRGIEFLLTFDEWLKIWEDSGHLHERGKHLGQYQMARHRDMGPYAIGNVKIVTISENRREDIENGGRERHSLVMRGKKHTKEHNEKIGNASRGRPCSQERKDNISKSTKESWSKFRDFRLVTASRGERNAASKLTEADVIQIRKEFVFCSRSCGATALGKKYGVNMLTILDVVRRVSWKHVA